MKQETSAGGVVYRLTEDNQIEIAIGKHSGHHRWVLPKGWLEEGETREQAAEREVKEEVGIEAKAGEYLGEMIVYFTNEKGEVVRKANHYFLMEYKTGEPEKDHGWEMEEAKWVKPAEATELLSYPSEQEMVQKALPLIKRVSH